MDITTCRHHLDKRASMIEVPVPTEKYSMVVHGGQVTVGSAEWAGQIYGSTYDAVE